MLLTREEVFSKVAEIISNHFEIDKDKVTVELSIKDDLNADSISIMEFVLELEDEFGTEILTKTLKKLKQLELQLITLWKTTKLNKKRCTSNLLCTFLTVTKPKGSQSFSSAEKFL